jgi:hypothetical protein
VDDDDVVVVHQTSVSTSSSLSNRSIGIIQERGAKVVLKKGVITRPFVVGGRRAECTAPVECQMIRSHPSLGWNL